VCGGAENMVPRQDQILLARVLRVTMIHGVFMEGAMSFRRKKSGDRTYFQVVENRWQDGCS